MFTGNLFCVHRTLKETGIRWVIFASVPVLLLGRRWRGRVYRQLLDDDFQRGSWKSTLPRDQKGAE